MEQNPRARRDSSQLHTQETGWAGCAAQRSRTRAAPPGLGRELDCRRRSRKSQARRWASLRGKAARPDLTYFHDCPSIPALSGTGTVTRVDRVRHLVQHFTERDVGVIDAAAGRHINLAVTCI